MAEKEVRKLVEKLVGNKKAPEVGGFSVCWDYLGVKGCCLSFRCKSSRFGFGR